MKGSLIKAGDSRTQGAVGQVVGEAVGSVLSKTLINFKDWFKTVLKDGKGAISGVIVSAASNILGVMPDDLDVKTALMEFDKSIEKLDQEIELLIRGVGCEPVKELEETYVSSKHSITNEDLRYNIENYLVNSRNPTYPFYYIKKCLELALKLPTKQKKLGRDDVLLRDFRKHDFFKRYALPTRQKLENVLINFIACSKAPDNCTLPMKKSYYFYGEAGVGKSSAIEMLARFMELPYYKYNIRSAAVDLSPTNIEGTDALAEGAHPGWLARPLLTEPRDNEKKEGSQYPTEGKRMSEESPKTESGEKDKKETYKNAILILDDFDRVLLDRQSAIASLAFFLDYLDPSKTHFYNHYFNAEIDISRMHIVVTGNTPLPSGSEYEALRERFSDIITFDPMEESNRKEILIGYLRELETFYDFNPGTLITRGDNLVTLTLKSAEHPTSIRSLRKTLQNIVSDFKRLSESNIDERIQYQLGNESVPGKKEPSVTAARTLPPHSSVDAPTAAITFGPAAPTGASSSSS